jgi:hypothetical protein
MTRSVEPVQYRVVFWVNGAWGDNFTINGEL